MKEALFLLLTLFSSLSLVKSAMETDTVSCPRLTCSENLGEGVCFMHSATNPVEWIKLANCPDGQVCDATQDFAWYDTFKQSIEQATELGKSTSW